MRETHGINDAIKISAGMSPDHEVLVRDRDDCVSLSIGGQTYPAGLSPEQARYIAKLLNEAAGRLEKT